MTKENNGFNAKLNSFIEKLEKTDLNDFFNPWKQTGKNDKSKDAAKIRCENLRNFLQVREKAEYMIIGEAPSEGARYTGIPMTSEEVIKNNPKIFSDKEYKLTSKTIQPEKTASIVWDEILKIDSTGKNFVIWNAFAFNSKTEGYVKNPTVSCITHNKNLNLLRMFLDLFPHAKLIAFGRTAQEAIGYAKSEYIRHPSRGGEKVFRENFSKKL